MTLLAAIQSANQAGMRVKFVEWLSQNGDIWSEFCKLTDMMRDKGRKRWGAKAVVEVLRWHRAVRDNNDVFKINNNWTADLGRLYNITHHTDFFEIRELHT